MSKMYRISAVAVVPNFWDMYVQSYQKVGHQYKNPNELVQDNLVWEAIEQDAQILAITAYKKTQHGLKAVILATRPEGKKLGIEFIKQFSKEGFYAEMCGKPAQIAINLNIPRVPAKIAAKVIDKPIIIGENEFEYKREITGLGWKTKTLFGNPINLV